MTELKKHGEELRERMYQFIIEYITENGYPPTVKEISASVGLKSVSSVLSHLAKLEAEGRIKIKQYTQRTIKVIGWGFLKVED